MATAFVAGKVYQDKLYLVGTTLPGDDMRIYDFGKQEWRILILPVTPPAEDFPFLDVYEGQLIQFVGGLCQSLCHNVWTAHKMARQINDVCVQLWQILMSRHLWLYNF